MSNKSFDKENQEKHEAISFGALVSSRNLLAYFTKHYGVTGFRHEVKTKKVDLKLVGSNRTAEVEVKNQPKWQHGAFGYPTVDFPARKMQHFKAEAIMVMFDFVRGPAPEGWPAGLKIPNCRPVPADVHTAYALVIDSQGLDDSDLPVELKDNFEKKAEPFILVPRPRITAIVKLWGDPQVKLRPYRTALDHVPNVNPLRSDLFDMFAD